MHFGLEMVEAIHSSEKKCVVLYIDSKNQADLHKILSLLIFILTINYEAFQYHICKTFDIIY